jgi:Serine/Threonine/Tyrosine Kinase found in polyvalent proteins
MPHESYLPERLPQAAQQAIEGSIIEAAEGIARRCHEAVRPDQAREFAAESRTADRRAGYFAVNRIVRPLEQEALHAWAQVNHLLLDTAKFTQKWQEQGCKGETEHEVYYDAPLKRWHKRNNFSNHGNWLEYFHRLGLHNWLFPAAALRFEGFMDIGEIFLPVVSQAHFVSLRGATENEIDQLMQRLGFEPIRLNNPARKFDYISRSIGVEVNDLHDENVLISIAGEPVVIDPVPMMEQESKLRRLASALA